MHKPSPFFVNLIAAGLLATLATPAAAEQLEDAPVRSTAWIFGSDWGWETVSLGVAGGLFGGSYLLHQQRTKWGPDTRRSENVGWNNVSFITVGGALAFGFTHYLLKGELLDHAGTNKPYAAALPVLFEDVEAVLLASSATNIIKARVGRCRPRAWHDGVCEPGSDGNFAAFPSGHTTIPSALAGVHLVELLRDSKSELNWISFVGVELAAISTGIMRVKAGAHSYSDVTGGYLIGHFTGIGLALAHPRAGVQNTSGSFRFVNPTFGFDGRVLTMGAAF